MSTGAQRTEDKRRWQEMAAEMYEELAAWREQHPEASFDEIAHQVTPRRQALMGELLTQLACQHGQGEAAEGLSCAECGHRLVYKGKPQRAVGHLEGEMRLRRAYYYCPQCRTGVFPPRPPVAVGETSLESGDDRPSPRIGASDSLLPTRGGELSTTDTGPAVQEQPAGLGGRVRGAGG